MSKTALMIIDMEYDFTNENGLVYYPQNKEILPKIADVLESARKNNLLVIFTQHRYRKGKKDSNLSTMRPSCIEGTKGIEIDDSLEVNYELDYIIQKRRYSGFYGTDLDLVLRENNIENVVLTGTKTNCCIRSTVHDAYYNNYNVYVIEECVATNSDVVNKVHLEDIDKYYGNVVTIEEYKKLLSEGKL